MNRGTLKTEKSRCNQQNIRSISDMTDLKDKFVELSRLREQAKLERLWDAIEACHKSLNPRQTTSPYQTIY
jgi:hypothetical protein